ncbi:MAG: Fic family protein [Betaproteobacteria bacterium]|nr:Fic family protein [Betaproteobacteria bacterium]
MPAVKPFLPKRLPRADLDWRALVPAIGRATRELARYDGILHGLPDPGLLLSPLTTQEAVLSSKIEGTQATLSDVLRFEAGEPASSGERGEDIREILNYRRALRAAERELKNNSLSLKLLGRLHAVLLDSVRGRDKTPGRIRRTRVWIGAPGAPIEAARFIPPLPARLPALLANLEAYWRGEELDPLVQLALIHAQFEIIHPFRDGNGRIGRMLVPLFLYDKKLLSRPMFYLSQYFEDHRAEYIVRLRALNGAQAWNAWTAFFLRAIAVQAEANGDKVRRILALYERLKAQAIALTRSQYAVPLLDRLFSQPIFASNDLFRDPRMPTKPVVTQLLRRLTDAGVLKQLREARGRRPQVLALAELVNLCEGKKAV